MLPVPNGVVAVYRKRPEERYTQMQAVNGQLNYVHPGYSVPQKFTAPDYSGGYDSSSKPDFRTTLHWDPEIDIDIVESRKVRFYASDQPSVYSVRFEGITDEGSPIVLKGTFEVH